MNRTVPIFLLALGIVALPAVVSSVPRDSSWDIGFADTDNDGLVDLEEIDAASDPANCDSDADGTDDGQDGWAVVPGFAPPRLPSPL